MKFNQNSVIKSDFPSHFKDKLPQLFSKKCVYVIKFLLFSISLNKCLFNLKISQSIILFQDIIIIFLAMNFQGQMNFCLNDNKKTLQNENIDWILPSKLIDMRLWD